MFLVIFRKWNEVFYQKLLKKKNSTAEGIGDALFFDTFTNF